MRFNESQTRKWKVGEVLFELFPFRSSLEVWDGKIIGQLISVSLGINGGVGESIEIWKVFFCIW